MECPYAICKVGKYIAEFMYLTICVKKSESTKKSLFAKLSAAESMFKNYLGFLPNKKRPKSAIAAGIR